ncbi:MAG: hypothetical protein ABIO29_07130 [Sphingomicrobium sp.]
MKRIPLPIFATLMVLTIAACEKRSPVAEEANAIAPPAVTGNSAGAVAGGPPPVSTGADPNGVIPVAVQGRWGLTPADCEPGRSDAKGLLTISGSALKFYESSAVPGTSIESGDRGISGNFKFTGEGESWSNYVSLKLSDNGLIRTERNPAASYIYARCD